LSIKVVDKPCPNARTKGTVIAPVVAPDASKAMARNAGGTKRLIKNISP
jgi:hypothetical protein